ncbi:hypothetical protein BKA14_003659 [Actinoplanes abujensis]|uniref:Uncharacterized protein n=1 Tax=Paractinoplanes abujensis TaxID=882441 RepID=A0A7W7CRR1_9ACTN|nr:hypothetical protein [Actinoplanes abujensis]
MALGRARDERTQVFANAGGSITAETSAVVQRVRGAAEGGRLLHPPGVSLKKL